MPKIVFNIFTGNFDYVLRPGETARTDAVLSGAIDGVNKNFTTPTKFVHNAKVSIAPYWNGQRLNNPEDYSVSESGGPGTGYDTIILVEAPRPTPKQDRVTADYFER